MILSDYSIRQAMRSGQIEICPYHEENLGSNSYDLTLGKNLLVYTDRVLDCKRQPNTKRLTIDEDSGFLMEPGELYLGVTNEKTTTRSHVPLIEGKSSIGRLGISVHVTAGVGDIGFAGHWTLEITVEKTIRVYRDMPIAQILFFLPLGECLRPYHTKKTAKYANQPGMPMPSMMYKNFIKEPV